MGGRGNRARDPVHPRIRGERPATEIALGHLTFDITFMPPTPAERITFESFIDINLLRGLGSQQ